MPSKLLIAASIPLVPLTCTALYLTYLNHRLSRRGIHISTTPHIQTASIESLLPKSIQAHKNNCLYILHHELVQASIPASALRRPDKEKGRERPAGDEKGDRGLEDVLTSFLRHTMTAFTRTPPSYAIRRALSKSSPQVLASFDAKTIRDLSFRPGDRVCGVYVVSSRSPGRVVMDLDAPVEYSGPKVEGMLIVEVQFEDHDRDGGEGEVRFTNHTVLWREKGMSSPNVLDTGVGRWVHGGLVRWMMGVGLDGVLAQSGRD
jgi:hypothetical protein